jgi:2-polyprenyl-6-methoxyphenol hydroxylase-like FAD-dependent oxidoreductase
MIERALIVGGGVGGMAAALALRRVGVEIALIDADPKWRVSGAGITLTGISLRALDDLGVLAEVRARGYVGVGLRARNASGEVEMEVAVPEHPQPIESTGGILRPELHAILSQRVRDSGTDVRLGVRVERIAQAADSVHAVFTDGREASYDLVVGADGIYSPLREMVFPNAAKPTFTGQGCWRVVARRPVDVDRSEMYFGGPVKIGLVPVSQDEMYMFLLEHVPDNPFYDDTERIPHLKKLMAPFGGTSTRCART